MANSMHLAPAELSREPSSLPSSPESLDAAAAAAVEKAVAAQSWYKVAIPVKRRGAIFTRLGAILLGSVATVIPTVLGIVSAERDPAFLQRWVPIGGVLAVVAALLVLVDKFAGYSSGWMRYIGADQELRSKQEQFNMAWAKERLLWPADRKAALAPERAGALLDLIGGFVAATNDVVKQETQAWMAEFKGALAELDRSTSEARAALAAIPAKFERGAIEVVVVGLAKLDKQSWTLQVGDTAAVPYVGTASAARVGLTPGPVKVRVDGVIGAKPWAVEKVAQVEAGKTIQVPVTAEG
jgi:hypothetical protein